jgi:hypothetical protein
MVIEFLRTEMVSMELGSSQVVQSGESRSLALRHSRGRDTFLRQSDCIDVNNSPDHKLKGFERKEFTKIKSRTGSV